MLYKDKKTFFIQYIFPVWIENIYFWTVMLRYWNLIWKYLKISLQYFKEFFYQNVFLSFFEILCAKIFCVTWPYGPKETTTYFELGMFWRLKCFFSAAESLLSRWVLKCFFFLIDVNINFSNNFILY